MFTYISRFILKNRTLLIVVLTLLTAFMAYMGRGVRLSYENASLLPMKDSTRIEYQKFKDRFGEDGNVIVIGAINPEIFTLKQFVAWSNLGDSLKKINGVLEVVSITRAINLVKNETTHQFDIRPVVNRKPTTQAEVDSLKNVILSLKFYQGMLFNPKTKATLMTISLDKNKINDISRIVLIDKIVKEVKNYSAENHVEIHYSGMPYIRTVTMQKIKHELFLFIIISIAVAASIMLFFFRSVKVVLSSLLVVGVSIMWVLGTLALFNYKITILTGVIPSLIVIIVIENCIYILNKYHWEFKNHGSKMRALSQVIHRIGFASLMTNAATALGFAAFILIPNQLLREFGVITSLNVMILYVLSITLLPIIFSYLDPPTPRQLKHLDSNFFGAVLDKIIYLINYRRNLIYSISGVLIVVGIIGVSLMKTSGKIVDDFRKDDPIYLDLKFFENNFGGVMPFEISVDTEKKNGILNYANIEKINRMEHAINEHPEFSRPLSLIEVFKFARQAYFGGDSSQYRLPSSMEKNFILSYIPQKVQAGGDSGLLKSFLDSTKQITRVSFQMADVGTRHMDSLMAKIRPQVDSIFPPSKFKVNITGNSVVYAKGTNFLIKNLFESVLIAVVLISLLMVFLFSSFRMILVSMVPNIIPLVITAAIMGYTGIPIKPSTIIVFSIALGISVDNAIQYLSRYRHELRAGESIKQSALNALHEAGFSMIYTSIVLVLGFSVFIVSEFGGTQALGILISTTLLIAMFFNIMVLPSLLLTLDKRLVSKAFTEPIIEIFEEEEEDSAIDLTAEFPADEKPVE